MGRRTDFYAAGQDCQSVCGKREEFVEAQFYGTDGDTPDEVGGTVEFTDGGTTIKDIALSTRR